MKTMILIICIFTLVGCASTQKEPSAKEQVKGLQKMCEENKEAITKRQKADALYIRLRKKKGITELVDKLYIAHKTNEKIGHMFERVPAKRFKKNVVAFLTIGTGGEGKYHGGSMKDVHAHLGITPADFLAAGGDVNSVMKQMKYGDNEIQEVVCALVSFVPVVVKM
jgi:truncated hemoglobin YjbI